MIYPNPEALPWKVQLGWIATAHTGAEPPATAIPGLIIPVYIINFCHIFHAREIGLQRVTVISYIIQL